MQADQCGNHMGIRFWEVVCDEHGIGFSVIWLWLVVTASLPSGTAEPTRDSYEKKYCRWPRGDFFTRE
jgi:hypothetical protein